MVHLVQALLEVRLFSLLVCSCSLLLAPVLHCVSKKCGVELFAMTYQLITDFENSVTVGNSNELAAK